MVINQRSIEENTLLLAQFQLRFNELEQQVAELGKKVERANVIFSKKVQHY